MADDLSKQEIAVRIALAGAPGLQLDPEAPTARVNELLMLDDTAFDALARSLRQRLRS